MIEPLHSMVARAMRGVNPATDRRWSQRQLAAQVGLSQTAMSYLMRMPHARPRPDVVVAIAGQLNLSREELLAAAGYLDDGPRTEEALRAEIGRLLRTSQVLRPDQVTMAEQVLQNAWHSSQTDEPPRPQEGQRRRVPRAPHPGRKRKIITTV